MALPGDWNASEVEELQDAVNRPPAAAHDEAGNGACSFSRVQIAS